MAGVRQKESGVTFHSRFDGEAALPSGLSHLLQIPEQRFPHRPAREGSSSSLSQAQRG